MRRRKWNPPMGGGQLSLEETLRRREQLGDVLSKVGACAGAENLTVEQLASLLRAFSRGRALCRALMRGGDDA